MAAAVIDRLKSFASSVSEWVVPPARSDPGATCAQQARLLLQALRKGVTSATQAQFKPAYLGASSSAYANLISARAMTGRQIMSDNDKEVEKILNSEHLLSDHACTDLALLTVHEAKLTLAEHANCNNSGVSEVDARIGARLDALEALLRTAPSYRTAAASDDPQLYERVQELKLKHMGQGILLLKLQAHKRHRTRRGWWN